jgi:hypothetical protein
MGFLLSWLDVQSCTATEHLGLKPLIDHQQKGKCWGYPLEAAASLHKQKPELIGTLQLERCIHAQEVHGRVEAAIC